MAECSGCRTTEWFTVGASRGLESTASGIVQHLKWSLISSLEDVVEDAHRTSDGLAYISCYRG